MHQKIKNAIHSNSTTHANVALITFGCSWTFGVGIDYVSGMTEAEHNANRHNESTADKHSFRGLLSSKFNCININFAHGGSSNQRQFRYASELFTNPLYMTALSREFDSIIVLWSITSTARNEMWDNNRTEYVNFKYDMERSAFVKDLAVNHYNHDVEVKKINENMILWNGFFKNAGISNLWADTFNSHLYKIQVDNLLPGNYMSNIRSSDNSAEEEEYYHMSSHVNDDPRIDSLISEELVNPYCLHPTKKGHKKIAKILTPYIEQLI